MYEPRVETRIAPVGAFQSVFLGEHHWTGFQLLNDEPLPDDEVLRRYNASDIILEDKLSYGGDYLFQDLDLIPLVRRGAVRVVCESNRKDEDEHPTGEIGTFSSLMEITDDDDDIVNYVRVVKKDYDETKSYEGFSR